MKRNQCRKAVVLGLAVLLATTVAGCKRAGGPAGAMKKKAGEKIGRIVFVGKKDACDCTRKRVKGSWDVLQAALKKHGPIQVKRIAMDVDKAEVRALREKRRFITLPAIYFYNPAGKLVGMLEGELKPDLIDEMLK